MTEFPATVHHLGLTVTDIEVSRQWYQRLLDAAPVLDEKVPAVPEHHQGFHKVVFVLPGGFVLALVAHPATDRNPRFDEFRPGLDHIGFGCADRSELEKWQNRLDEPGSPTASSPRTPSASPCPSATQTTSPSSSSRPGHSNRQPAGINTWHVHGGHELPRSRRKLTTTRPLALKD